MNESGGASPAGGTGPKSKKAAGSTSSMALRNWRISTRLVALLTLPVVAATTLGGMRMHTAMSSVDQLDNMKLLTEMTEHATDLASALQEERDRSAGPLVGTGNAKDDAVVGPREKTDRAFQAFKEATTDIDNDDKVMAGVQATVLDITRQLTAIKNIRERAYDNPSYVSQTVNSYNQLIESLLSLSQDMAQATSNPEMIQSTRALAAFSGAKEFASIQRAIISAGLARKGGPELSESDRLYALTASDSERASLTSFSKIYGDERAAGLTKPLDGSVPNIVSADQYRDRVLKNADGISAENRSYMDWYDQDRTKIDEMMKIESTLLSQMEQQARELRSEAQAGAFINGAIILLVLGISLVGAFVVARSMVRSLRRLQDTAQDVARKRLPELVKQMSESEPQELDTSVESVGVHSKDEIGQVASAFDDVHREAVRLAGEQALLRGNVNAMFTNLSRRSQGLIQRQLSLISELESREADPDQLSSLFKLDHLATRMRRNGENLLVLAGEEPGRRWTRPVPLVDVLRAAASEVEQYERIELNSVPATEVAGRVVNDLVHLLAELLENATSFSSPQTKVKVTGHALPDGRVLVEIHDTGIGLSPEDLSSINERLANPPTVDVSVSRRMGLFVVGRLSLRHGIRIQLRPSDSGGTTALVMLPVDVAQGGGAGGKGAPGGAPGKAAPGGSGAKGGGLAAALQRGGPGGPGASGRPGGAPRGQVSGGTRPALPGAESGAPTTNLFGDSPSGRPPQDGSAPNASGVPAPAVPSPGRPGESRPARPAGPSGAPPLPTRSGPAGELTGGSGTQGPSGATASGSGSAGPGDTAEMPQIGSGGTGPAELTEIPGASAGRPGAQGSAPAPRPAPEQDEADAAESGQQGPGDTAEFARPAFNTPRPGEGPDDIPGASAGRPGAEPAGNGPAAEDADAAQQRPSWAAAPGAEDAPRGHDEPESTGEYARPGYTGATAGGQDTDGHGYPAPQDTDPAVLPGSVGADAVDAQGIPVGPPAEADAPTPIFASMESNWFRGGTGSEAPRQAPSAQDGPAPYAPDPSQTQATRPGGPAPSVPPMPQRPTARGTDNGAAPTGAADTTAPPASAPEEDGAQWGASPNDERWRRAEQVRQPAAGGVTTSGLPRRVPRANLVAGTAQQQSSAQSGPQVSRAPDDVRGRLTNLRRGIQQGRQAGSTDGRGTGPTYQQER